MNYLGKDIDEGKLFNFVISIWWKEQIAPHGPHRVSYVIFIWIKAQTMLTTVDFLGTNADSSDILVHSDSCKSHTYHDILNGDSLLV